MFGYGEVNQYNRGTLMSAYKNIKLDQFMYHVIKDKGKCTRHSKPFRKQGAAI